MIAQGSYKEGMYTRDLLVEYQAGVPRPKILNDPNSCISTSRRTDRQGFQITSLPLSKYSQRLSDMEILISVTDKAFPLHTANPWHFRETLHCDSSRSSHQEREGSAATTG